MDSQTERLALLVVIDGEIAVLHALIAQLEARRGLIAADAAMAMWRAGHPDIVQAWRSLQENAENP